MDGVSDEGDEIAGPEEEHGPVVVAVAGGGPASDTVELVV